MSTHTHDFDAGTTSSPHLSVSREIEEADATMVQAVADGRTDAVSPGAVLDLQRLVGNSSVDSVLDEDASPVHEVIGSGGGSPLESSTRDFMESRLGQDFGNVRVHTGSKADESARSINAVAYTAGTDVVFREGAYQPDTQAGQRTLAHELAHVVQQRAGPVDGSPTAGGLRVSDPSDGFERAAERAADEVVGGGTSTSIDSARPAAAVQRETGKEEEEELQMLAAQRQGDEPEEEEEEENPSA